MNDGNGVCVRYQLDQVGVAGSAGTVTVAGLAFGGELAIEEAGKRLKLPGRIARLGERIKRFDVAGMASDLQAQLDALEPDLSAADAALAKATKTAESAEQEYESARRRRADAPGQRASSAARASDVVSIAQRAWEGARCDVDLARALWAGLADRCKDLRERLANLGALTVYRRLAPRLTLARDDLGAREAALCAAKKVWLDAARDGDTADEGQQLAALTAEVTAGKDRVAALECEVMRCRGAAGQAAGRFAAYCAEESVRDIDRLIGERKADLVKLGQPATEILALGAAREKLLGAAREIAASVDSLLSGSAVAV